MKELTPGMWCIVPGIRGAYQVAGVRYPEVCLRKRQPNGALSDDVEMWHIDEIIVVTR